MRNPAETNHLLPARPEARRLLGGRPPADASAADPPLPLSASRGMAAAEAGSTGMRCAGVCGRPLPRLSALLRALLEPALRCSHKEAAQTAVNIAIASAAA